MAYDDRITLLPHKHSVVSGILCMGLLTDRPPWDLLIIDTESWGPLRIETIMSNLVRSVERSRVGGKTTQDNPLLSDA